MKTFGWVAHKAFSGTERDALVVRAPPRSRQRGQQDHLDDLLCALEQVNFEVLRQVLAYDEKDAMIVQDCELAQRVRGQRIIFVDNLWKFGDTARSAAAKILQLGAAEVHLCIMGRWLNPDRDSSAIDTVRTYRQSVCPDQRYIHRWYYEHVFGPRSS